MLNDKKPAIKLNKLIKSKVSTDFSEHDHMDKNLFTALLKNELDKSRKISVNNDKMEVQ